MNGEKLEKEVQRFRKYGKKHFLKYKIKLINFLIKIFSKELKLEKIKSKKLEPMATRKCSEKTLIRLTKKDNALIGGSADLAGSNNTKTKTHKIIETGKFFRKLYSLRS